MKLITMLLFLLGINFSVMAQEKTKTEVKPTTTVGQKVHNTFSKHKHHKGHKYKKTYPNGSKHITKTNSMTGAVKRKHKPA
ncbi:MAG: hypothetical protein ABIW38_13555 [Ferruginibacter sp.]